MARATRDRPVVAWLLRSFLLLNFCSAVGFIVYALILQNPPKTSLPLGMLIVGIVALIAVLVGLVGSLRVNCALTLYLYLGGLVTLAELGITLSLFFNYGNTVDDLVQYEEENDPDFNNADAAALRDKVAAGRWFFLVVCILQFISVVVALVLRVCVYPRERDFESFEEPANSEANGRSDRSQVQMQKLQASVTGRQASSGGAPSPGAASYASSKLNRSTTNKMAAKYGAYTSDADFQPKSGWLPWRK